jgi:hypothetical protein
MEKEKRQEIVVLDEGTDVEHMAGPGAFAVVARFLPLDNTPEEGSRCSPLLL